MKDDEERDEWLAIACLVIAALLVVWGSWR